MFTDNHHPLEGEQDQQPRSGTLQGEQDQQPRSDGQQPHPTLELQRSHFPLPRRERRDSQHNQSGEMDVGHRSWDSNLGARHHCVHRHTLHARWTPVRWI